MDITSVKKLDPSDMRLGTVGLSLAFLQPFPGLHKVSILQEELT